MGDVAGPQKRTIREKLRLITLSMTPVAAVAILVGALGLNPAVRSSNLAELGYVALQTPASLEATGLRTGDGLRVDPGYFKDKWSLVFFGYTACPDACPTTLAVLNQVVATLATRRLQVLLVGTDPNHDDPVTLLNYARAFNPTFDAAAGATADVLDFARQLHVLVGSDENPSDHSLNVALIDPRGQFVGYFKIPHQPRKMPEALQTLMAAG